MAHELRTGAQLDLRPRLMAKLILVGLALACASADARAAISVDSASYKAGLLTVEGHTTKAHQTVTLDGIYRARSDKSGSFRIPHPLSAAPLHDASSIRHGYISRHSRQLPSHAMTFAQATQPEIPTAGTPTGERQGAQAHYALSR